MSTDQVQNLFCTRKVLPITFENVKLYYQGTLKYSLSPHYHAARRTLVFHLSQKCERPGPVHAPFKQRRLCRTDPVGS